MCRMRCGVVVQLVVPDDGVAHLLLVHSGAAVVHRQVEGVHAGAVGLGQRMVIEVCARFGIGRPVPHEAVARRDVLGTAA